MIVHLRYTASDAGGKSSYRTGNIHTKVMIYAIKNRVQPLREHSEKCRDP